MGYIKTAGFFHREKIAKWLNFIGSNIIDEHWNVFIYPEPDPDQPLMSIEGLRVITDDNHIMARDALKYCQRFTTQDEIDTNMYDILMYKTELKRKNLSTVISQDLIKEIFKKENNPLWEKVYNHFKDDLSWYEYETFDEFIIDLQEHFLVNAENLIQAWVDIDIENINMTLENKENWCIEK